MRLSVHRAVIALVSLVCTLRVAVATDDAGPAELEVRAQQALQLFCAQRVGNRELVSSAQGLLIFPETAARVAGAGTLSGDGILQLRGRTAGRYTLTTKSAAVALWAGRRGKLILFMTQSALDEFMQRTESWDVESSVSVVDAADAAEQLGTQHPPSVLGIDIGSGASLSVELSLRGAKIVPSDAARAASEVPYDLVIENGRVLDPETNLDQVASVGVRNGTVAMIATRHLRGRRTIDASGLVVAPGFIDLHAHGQNLVAADLQAQDGVTTAMDLEVGTYPIEQFYARREGRSRINFGASVSHQGIRIMLKTGEEMGHPASDAQHVAALLARREEWAASQLSADEVRRGLQLFREGMAAGGLGLGLTPEYTPGADRSEVYLFTNEAATLHAPVFVHVRAANHPKLGGLFEMMQEVIADAAVTGAPLHICHVTSKGLNDTGLILDAIANAQRRGIDITTEAYPYTAGSTAIGSALFDEGWQQRWDADYADLEWPTTGERLTAATFARYRKESPGSAVSFHMIPAQAMDLAIANPLVMIASDGGTYADGAGHPRGAGTFARVLGHYVRERGSLTLMAALRKMTIMPARRLEQIAPAMRKKGRLQPGMDADITVFDPKTIADQATYQDSMRPSRGVAYVLVGGVAVVSASRVQTLAFPGRGIRSVLAQ